MTLSTKKKKKCKFPGVVEEKKKTKRKKEKNNTKLNAKTLPIATIQRHFKWLLSVSKAIKLYR